MHAYRHACPFSVWSSIIAAGGLWLVLSQIACREPAAPQNASIVARATSLRIGVVEDPAIVEAIQAAGGDWSARRGTEIHAEVIPLASLNQDDAKGFDALFYPPRQLGDLATEGIIRAIPRQILDTPELGWDSYWPALRDKELVWGEEPMAIPVGARTLFCYVRGDLLASVGQEPPGTWSEYGEAASALRSGTKSTAPSDWLPCLEPLAPGWAGVSLLVRAAPYAQHPDYYSVLFDVETMEPHIATAPFVRALEEMKSCLTTGGTYPRLTPGEVHQAFLAGRCGLAIAWPSIEPVTNSASDSGTPPPGSWHVVPIPGSRDVYHPGTSSWEEVPDGEPRRVPVLGLGGMVAAVCKSSHQAGATFQFLAWLCGREWGPRLILAQPSLQPVRALENPGPEAWPGESIPPSTEDEFRQALRVTMTARATLQVPRLPGHEEYLRALDVAVWSCLDGETTAESALEEAAQTWRSITERRGRDSQRDAYRSSLGIGTASR